MTLKEVVALLEAEVLVGKDNLHSDFVSICGADLLSDVLTLLKDRTLLLTGLVNPQVIRTAEVMDIIGVVIVRGKRPDTLAIELAEQKGLPVLLTKYSMFEACGRLYLYLEKNQPERLKNGFGV